MAFGAPTNLISTNNKASSSSWTTAAVGVNKPVGSLIVASLVTDNSGTTDVADSTEHQTVTDSAGNSWTKIREARNANGAAAGGVTVSVWYCILTSPIVAGSTTFTITVSTAVTAKYFRADESTYAAGYSVGVVDAASYTSFRLDDAADPGSLSTPSSVPFATSSLLLLRFSGGEGTPVVMGAVTGGWTAWINSATAGTTGGSGPSNVSACGEYKITDPSALPLSSDPTWQAVDGASLLAILFEKGKGGLADTRRVQRNSMLRR